jgi:hypothetical protein
MLNLLHHKVILRGSILLFTILFPQTGILAQEPDLSQKISVQYEAVPLEKVLQDISGKSNIRFSYSNELIPAQREITIRAENIPLKKLLAEIFQQAGIQFEVVNGYLVLTS